MEIQEWDDEQCREFARRAGIPPGHAALVRDEHGNVAICRGGASEGPVEPDCDPSVCREVAPAIRQVCKNNNWPPGWKILVCDANGDCCVCTCP